MTNLYFMDRLYVKTKEIRVDMGKIIGRLMKLREEADYYPEATFRFDDSSDAIEKAEAFINEVKNFFEG